MLIRSIVFFMTFLCLTDISAQTLLSGTVVDSLNQPVRSVSITYSKPHAASISGFTQSDDKGKFSLKISLQEDRVQLNFNHLTYGKKTIIIPNKSTDNLLVSLTEKAAELKDVVVETSPIYKRGDTINYSVGAFTSKDDRVIGDIIKKLPGIEMDGSRILYQGKPIQKYAINGLDLLEGKYSIANENLPADAVQSVQVVENDQPVKILDSLVFSDRASLNIKLKKFTTTGSGKLGIGALPLLWDVNLTPMTFNKTFQSINSYQTNNVGDDVSRQLESYSFGSAFDTDIPESQLAFAKSFINLHGIITPPFEQKRWLRNNIHMLSTNVLQKLKNNVEIKGNASYINDYRQLASFARSSITTPGQTIEMTEALENNFNINDLRGNISFVKNEKEIYLRNKTSFGKRWNNDVGNIIRNDTDKIYQRKNLSNLYFANKLGAAKFLGKQLVNISSYIHYAETPQTLTITPGQFAGILNNDNPYDKVQQQVAYKKFSTDNYFSFAKGLKGFTLMPKFGVAYDKNTIQSDIAVFNGNTTSPLEDDFINDIVLNNTRLYANLNIQYRRTRWRMDMQIPVEWSAYKIQNKQTPQNNTKNYLYSNPRFYIIYQLGNNWETTVSSGYNNSFGAIDQMYTAYLLSSYRNMQRYSTVIPRSRNFTGSLAFNYKNTMKATFANIYLRYSKGSNDFIYKNDIDENGLNTIELVEQKSYQSSQSVNADISKFIKDWKTTVKLKGNASVGQSEQIINNVFEKINTQQLGSGLEVNNTLLDYMLFGYNGSISIFQNKLGSKSLAKVLTQKHQFNVSVYPVDNHSLTVNTEYYYNNLQTSKNQVFVDLVYRWALPKKKLDFELACNNLLNNKTFFSVYTYTYTIVENSFEMRPRQFLASVKFRF